MEVVGESILTAAIEVLFSKLASSDLLKFARQEEVIDELEGWKRELRVINEVLDEAEEQQITKSSVEECPVEEWVDDLRDLAYDMEDVVDEFATEMLRRRSMSDQVASTSKVRSLVRNCFTGFNPVGEVKFNFEIGSKIRVITRRLGDISRRKAELGLKGLQKFAPGAASTWRRPPSTCLINEPVHGRDGDKKTIVDRLLNDEAGLEVVPIVGIGGIGKTTLVQFIFRDEEIVKHFEPRVWVCVSDETDLEKLTRTILNAVSPDEVRDGDDFNQVQLKLSKNLAGKRFFLVLDDVWNIKSYEQWNQLRAPLKSGALGSKIVLTARDKNVASLMGTDGYHHFLAPLSNDDCWSVFVEHAFEGKTVEEHPNLKSIGEKIVKKCSGSPLAAKMVGGLLRSKYQVEAWNRILGSSIWNLSECGIIPILRLSYQNLSPRLKRCFAYTALFPKDYEFEEKQLILLWMAEGLIYQAKGDNRPIEDIGADYFNELLSRCFFQPSNKGKQQFVMHDLINDLAQHVAAKICFNLENKHQIFESIRYLSFVRGEYDAFTKFEVFDKLEKLRTCVALPINMVNGKKCYLSTKVLDELLPKLRCLRVLSLSFYEINELPDTIGDLKHLRYLNVSHTALKWLPEGISGLYNLQSLILCNCRKLTKLPMGIVNLINLRHLDISGSTMLEEMPPRIDNLINLQTLSKFVLSKGSGSRVKELKKLLNLRGELAISRLDNITDPEDAMYVDMKERTNIEDLILVWSPGFGNSRNGSNEMEVLKWLQPHESLKSLTITFYGGLAFPHWLGDPSFSRVMQLRLRGCKKCTLLPPFGRLSFLKHLEIEGMNKIRSIGEEFYGDIGKPFGSLEYLRFENMPVWRDWLSPDLGEGTEALFPCLRELLIINCPQLSSLPNQVPSLENLYVKKCQELTISIPQFPSLTFLKVNSCNEGMLKSRVVDVPSLTRLFIEDISKPSCLWEGLAQPLTVLEDMGINQCDELASLRLEDLGGLRRLWILGCNEVVSLAEQPLPCNLQFLEMRGCSNIEKLPNELYTLAFLTVLVIRNCPKLASFPSTGFPPMLRAFVVRNCPSLTGFPKCVLPTTLKTFFVQACEKLESLPEGIMHQASIHSENSCCLEWLHVWECSSLKSIPKGDFPSTLEVLSIWKCMQLESIPGKALQNLTSLHHLDLCNCPDVMSSPKAFLPTNLRRLAISGSKNTKRPPSTWGFHTFTSLERITIGGPSPDTVSFLDNGNQLLPTSLTLIHIIGFRDLKSIAFQWLQSLVSLRTLELYDCPKLQFLVPKEGLPPTLSRLAIRKCPILKKRCLKNKGKDWRKIAHIPYVEIDGVAQQ